MHGKWVFFPEEGKREIEVSFLPFATKVESCRDIFQREKLCDRFPLAWIRMCIELLSFFFVVPLDRWRFEYKGLGRFRLFENRISKVLDAFKRNIVIFSRDWLRRIIFLFFFVPGKRQLDTFYRRDENRLMVSRWKFSSSYIYFVTLGIQKKKKKSL